MTTTHAEPGLVRRLATRGSIHAWGLVSQGLSSATTFAVTIIAARALGPEGLGQVAVGLAAYLVVSGLTKGSVIEPLVAVSAAEPEDVRRDMTRGAVTLVLAIGALGSLVVLTLGLVIGGSIGPGLVAISAWIIPASLVELWRAVLFRDGKPSHATRLNLAWLLTLLVLAPLAFRYRSAATSLGIWGTGALAGALVGATVLRMTPSHGSDATRFARRIRRFALAKAASFGTYSLGHQVVLFSLAALLGVRALGDLRGAEALFAPLTILLPAMTLSMLPELTRQVSRSGNKARHAALTVSCAATATTSLYLVVAATFGSGLVRVVLGEPFDGVTALLLPIGAAQLAVAAGSGAGLLLNARERGRQLLRAAAIQAASAFVLATALASTVGLVAAAWGLAASSATGAAVRSWYAFRSSADETSWIWVR